MDWQLHLGRAEDILPGEYAGRVNLVVTSPPYDGLRRYGGYADAFAFDAIADALLPCLAPGGVIVWVVADAIVDGSETGTSFRQALGFMDARAAAAPDDGVRQAALPPGHNGSLPTASMRICSFLLIQRETVATANIIR